MATRKRKKRILAEEIAGVVLIAFAVLLALGIFSSSNAIVLDTFKQICWGVFGAVSYILPVALVALGVYLLLFADKKRKTAQVVCYAIIAVCFICIVHLMFVSKIAAANYGDFIQKSYDLGRVMHEGAGGLGGIFTYPCLALFGTVGSYIFLIAAAIICALIGTNLSFREVKKDTSAKLEVMRKDHERRRELRLQRKRENELDEEETYATDDYYQDVDRFEADRSARYRRSSAASSKQQLKVFTIEEEPERIRGSRVADSEADIDFIPGMPHASHLTARYAPWQEQDEPVGFDDCFTDDEMFTPQMEQVDEQSSQATRSVAKMCIRDRYCLLKRNLRPDDLPGYGDCAGHLRPSIFFVAHSYRWVYHFQRYYLTGVGGSHANRPSANMSIGYVDCANCFPNLSIDPAGA